FDNLFLLARAAAGKSELIDFFKNTPEDKRIKEHHIGKFEEIDDFPWIWQACEADDKREANGEARIDTVKTSEGVSLLDQLFRLKMVPKFNKAINEKYMSRPEFYENGTLFIEFARGKADGFKTTLEGFDDEILQKGSILYVKVSHAESYRRNNARYKEGQEGSILFHKVPDKDMNEYFIENDWEEITGGKENGYLEIKGIKIPFVTMLNEPELPPGPEISARYENALNKLFELYCNK
ncbi:hypothetical protein KKA47_04985, partial [bacterium]|nr:hypothetical protein [bacterium]